MDSQSKGKPLPRELEWYLAKGWPVFPIVPGGKSPLTPNGFKDATLDVTTIERWARRFPNCNWAIPCGPDTFDAIDVDNAKTWYALEEKHGVQPRGPVQRTGRGNLQIWVKGGTLRTGTNTLGDGIDTRAHGSYVVVAPSKTIQPYVVDNADEEFPEPEPWVLEILERTEKTKRANLDPTSRAPIEAGSRNDTIFRLASSLRSQQFDEILIREICHHQNRERCRPSPLDEDEVNAIVDGVLARYNPGPSAQFKKAEDAAVKEARAAQEEAENGEQLERAMNGDEDHRRSLVRELLELNVARVRQLGEWNPSYELELADGRRIGLGGDLCAQTTLRKALYANCRNTALLGMGRKKFRMLVEALTGLIEVDQSEEFEEFSAMREVVARALERQHAIPEEARKQAIPEGRPYVLDGWLWVNRTWLGQQLRDLIPQFTSSKIKRAGFIGPTNQCVRYGEVVQSRSYWYQHSRWLLSIPEMLFEKKSLDH